MHTSASQLVMDICKELACPLPSVDVESGNIRLHLSHSALIGTSIHTIYSRGMASASACHTVPYISTSIYIYYI